MTRDVTTVSFIHFWHEEKSMLVTAEVLKKFGPNRRLVMGESPLNVYNMPVTDEVSKEDRSREVRA